ncbi:MAG: transcriptional antiterminator, Rof [Gammaproteobacteria bacterium]|jgi:Rho-binding antiterminator
MTDYNPIDCQTYSRYELAILHQTALVLCWRDTSGIAHLESLMPLDLETRRGEEFLIARTRAGRSICLRLDHIIEARNASTTEWLQPPRTEA